MSDSNNKKTNNTPLRLAERNKSVRNKTTAKPASKDNISGKSVMMLTAILAVIFSTVLICTLFTVDKLPAEETTAPVETTESGPDLSSLPEGIVNLYNKNPEARDYVLSFAQEHDKEHKIDLKPYLESEEVPLFLQWDKSWGYLKYAGDYVALSGCGPTCLSMVAFHLKRDTKYSVKYMIEFATKKGYSENGGGSPWVLISEGAKKLGFKVEEVPLVEAKIKEHLDNGKPIICNVGPGDFTTIGHYIVFRKYDNGNIYVNDPNSANNSSKAWSYNRIKDQIRNMWAISL